VIVACCAMMPWLQQLELTNEPSHPGSSLSLRVQPPQSTGTPATSTSRPGNENSDAVNNNVMSHSVTNPQTLTSQHVKRSSSTTNPQKPGQLRDTRNHPSGSFVTVVFLVVPNFCILFFFLISRPVYLVSYTGSLNFIAA